MCKFKHCKVYLHHLHVNRQSFPTVLEYLPPSQRIGADDPDGQYAPAGQISPIKEPVKLLYTATGLFVTDPFITDRNISFTRKKSHTSHIPNHQSKCRIPPRSNSPPRKDLSPTHCCLCNSGPLCRDQEAHCQRRIPLLGNKSLR